MRVILANQRYFVAPTEQDVYTVALRLLNEQRVVMQPGDLKNFVDEVTDAQDGPTAVKLVEKLLGFKVFPAEVV